MKNEEIISLFNANSANSENVQKAFEFLCINYDISVDKHESVKDKLKKLASKFKTRWQQSNRMQERFTSKNGGWLEIDFNVEEFIENYNEASSSSAKKRGRPSKSFSELCERGKRRTIDNQQIDPKVDTIEKALLIARRTAYNRRDSNLVKVIGHILKNQEKSKQMYIQLKDQHTMLTPDEAFGLFMEAGLSKFQYQVFRRNSPSIYPSYDVIGAMKQTCAPPKESIEESASRISVKLQALLENTVIRIMKIIDGELSEFMDSNDMDSAELILLSSWGMDGSTGYSQYNQALPEGCQDDSDIFSATLTPIRLFMHDDEKRIMWFNKMPQSIRFCRPFLLQFIKESKELILATKMEVEKEMSELTPVKVELQNGKCVLIDFDFVLSMIDGKVLTYITGNSSMQNCPICGAKPNTMNSIEMLEEGFKSNEESLHYGISPLHAWIRFFECLLHISYRMDFKKWRVTKELKEQYVKKKKHILGKLYEKFGLRVDQPRSGGSGTSTTGNICRRAFADPQLLSSVLNIDEELIVRFRNILISINCQEPINPEKFDAYCKETYKLYLELYSWYKIPATLHKILAHAGEIILHSPAPLGTLAEEAAECQHKQFKKYRTHHARKRSRLDNLHDVFIRAMNESDPYISTIWMETRRKNKKSLDYPDIVKDFLIFDDSDCSTEDTSECKPLEDLLDAVDEVEENFDCDNNVESDE